MFVVGDIPRDRLIGIASDQFHFLLLIDETIAVKFLNRQRKLGDNIVTFPECSRFGMLPLSILRGDPRESGKRIKSDDLPVIIVWLQRRRYLRPGHHPATMMYAALDDASL